MLTKNDLQQIRTLVKEEVQLGTKPIKKQLNKVAKDVDTIIVHFDNRLTKVENNIKVLKGN